MNFLIVAVFGMILSVPRFCEANGGGYDLAQIKTVHGKVYREIYILEADSYGLTFRHRDGIAKVVFPSLPANLRMLYETTEELGEVESDNEKGELEKTEDIAPQETDPIGVTRPGNFGSVPLVFTVRNRVTIPSSALWLGGGYLNAGRMGWPGRWHRYGAVHELANPYYRELVVRDFLYSSGLISKPPGISTYRIPCRSRPLFY